MPAHIRISSKFLIAALTVPLLFFRPSHSQSNQSASLFHEDVLAELTPGAEAKQILVGNHHLAWIEKLGDKRSVHLDGQQLGKPAQIVAAIVAFAILGKATDWLVVTATAPLLRWQDVYGSSHQES